MDKIRTLIEDFNNCQDMYIAEYTKLGVVTKRIVGSMTVTESILSWPIDYNELNDSFEAYIRDIDPYEYFDVKGHF